MHMELFIPFALAAELVLIIPGPTILLVVSLAVAHGHRSVIPLVIGVLLGDFTAMSLSLMGLGAVMAASAAMFTIFKLFGAVYLIYLGIRLWMQNSSNRSSQIFEASASSALLLKRSFVVTALNPKSIAFFVAFLPQFVSPAKPALPQLFILGSAFLFLATLNAALYAIFAGYLSDYMQKQVTRKWFNRCGGTALIGAGIFTVGMRQTT